MKHILVCSQNGLGDLFFSLFLAKNISSSQSNLVLYYGNGSALQDWVDYAQIVPYPQSDQVEKDLETFDEIFVFYHQDNAYIKKLILDGKKNCPDKVCIFYPYPTPHVRKKPFYLDSCINPSLSFFQNIEMFLKRKGFIEGAANLNFLSNPEKQKKSRRVLLHVCSSNVHKDWPIEKFMALADRLIALSFEVFFITKERKYYEQEWKWLSDLGYNVPLFDNLVHLGKFLSESALVIGVDSGICHFASALKVPVLVIGRREKILKFWQPHWEISDVVFPMKWIPNLYLFRFRDRFWKQCISLKKVEKKGLALLKKKKDYLS